MSSQYRVHDGHGGCGLEDDGAEGRSVALCRRPGASILVQGFAFSVRRVCPASVGASTDEAATPRCGCSDATRGRVRGKCLALGLAAWLLVGWGTAHGGGTQGREPGIEVRLGSAAAVSSKDQLTTSPSKQSTIGDRYTYRHASRC